MINIYIKQLFFILVLTSISNVVFAQVFTNGFSVTTPKSAVHADVIENSRGEIYEALVYQDNIDLADLGSSKKVQSLGLTDICLLKLDSNSKLLWALKIGGQFYDGNSNVVNLAQTDSDGVIITGSVELYDSVMFYNADESVGEIWYKSNFTSSVPLIGFCAKVNKDGKIVWVVPFMSERIDPTINQGIIPTSVSGNTLGTLVISVKSQYNIRVIDKLGFDTTIQSNTSSQDFSILMSIDLTGKISFLNPPSTFNNTSELISARVFGLNNKNDFYVSSFINIYSPDSLRCNKPTSVDVGSNVILGKCNTLNKVWDWIVPVMHNSNLDLLTGSVSAVCVTNNELFLTASYNVDVNVYDLPAHISRAYSPINQSWDAIILRFDLNGEVKDSRVITGTQNEFPYSLTSKNGICWLTVGTNSVDASIDSRWLVSISGLENFYCVSLNTSLNVQQLVALPSNFTLTKNLGNNLLVDSLNMNVFGNYSMHDMYLGCRLLPLKGLVNCAIINNKTNYKDTSIAFCGAYKPKYGVNLFKESGIYFDTSYTQNGCNEIIRIDFKQLQTQIEIYDTLCTYYLSPSGKHIWGYSGVYFDTIKNSVGCDSIIKFNLEINRPLLSSSVSNPINCDNRSAEITVSGANSYKWFRNEFLDIDSGQQVTITPLTETLFIVKGYGKDTSCWSYDTIPVTTNFTHPINEMPNVITPNNDGVNECISPNMVCEFSTVSFTIFNRWGNLVTELNNSHQLWCGSSSMWELANGTYYYIIVGKSYCNLPVEQKGTITIIK